MHWCDATTGPRTVSKRSVIIMLPLFLCCLYTCLFLHKLTIHLLPSLIDPDLPQAAGIFGLIECSVVADEDMYGAYPNERKHYLQECQTEVNDLYMNLHSVFVSPTPGDPTGHLVHP